MQCDCSYMFTLPTAGLACGINAFTNHQARILHGLTNCLNINTNYCVWVGGGGGGGELREISLTKHLTMEPNTKEFDLKGCLIFCKVVNLGKLHDSIPILCSISMRIC